MLLTSLEKTKINKQITTAIKKPTAVGWRQMVGKFLESLRDKKYYSNCQSLHILQRQGETFLTIRYLTFFFFDY